MLHGEGYSRESNKTSWWWCQRMRSWLATPPRPSSRRMMEQRACLPRKMPIFSKYCPAWWVAMERAGSYASGEKAPKVGADGAGVLRRGDRLGDRSRASH